MKAWIESVLKWVGVMPSRRPGATIRRASRPRGRWAPEALERREVLAASGVIPFATLPAQITTPGQPAQVVLHFAPGDIATDRSSSVLIGFYAKAAAGSSANPQISEVDGPMGQQFRVNLPQRFPNPNAKAVFITGVNTTPGKAEDITVNIKGLDNQVGGVVLEAFLPGDVNGDKSVDAIDLNHLQAIYGSAAGQANFDPAADFNADSHVGCIDRRLTQLNQGARVNYTPVAPTPPAPAPAPVTLAPAAAPATVAVTPVLTTPVVAATVQANPVVVATPVQANPVVVTTPVQANPVVVTTPVQATPAAVPAATQAVAAVPLYSVPVAQAPPSGYVSSAAPTLGYAQPAAVYYYTPQPTAQSQLAGYVQGAAPVQSSAPAGGYYYYGTQPMVQGQATGYVPSAGPLVYYGQPVVQGPTR